MQRWRRQTSAAGPVDEARLAHRSRGARPPLRPCSSWMVRDDQGSESLPGMKKSAGLDAIESVEWSSTESKKADCSEEIWQWMKTELRIHDAVRHAQQWL